MTVRSRGRQGESSRGPRRVDSEPTSPESSSSSQGSQNRSQYFYDSSSTVPTSPEASPRPVTRRDGKFPAAELDRLPPSRYSPPDDRRQDRRTTPENAHPVLRRVLYHPRPPQAYPPLVITETPPSLPSSQTATSATSSEQEQEDLPPSTNCYTRSSEDTYDSRLPSDSETEISAGLAATEFEDDTSSSTTTDSFTSDSDLDFSYSIPPLPTYRPNDPVVMSVRPSSPQEFARLFPSMDRLSIRHDDFSPDGNMNLRVETTVPGRRPFNMQLFHLRMHDLARREFSLRRYCRDSGREVCNAKRRYEDHPSSAGKDRREGSSLLPQAVSTALRRPFRRANTFTGPFADSKRPNSSHSSWETEDERNGPRALGRNPAKRDTRRPHRPRATNTIKLEFSNYARVDVTRRGRRTSRRYDFEWWGHRYSWRRVMNKNIGGIVSFHLIRDGNSGAGPVAHVVPEARSPNQIRADDEAGGWIPPCHMWINDESIMDAMTDVADVLVATGLMALVDDCIEQRWPSNKKTRRLPVPGMSRSMSVEHRARPMATFVQNILPRRNTPFAAGHAIAKAYPACARVLAKGKCRSENRPFSSALSIMCCGC